MLVMTRRIGEKIVIGPGTIEIELLGIKGRNAVLGVKAPPDVSVHRQEIYLKIISGEKKDV